MRSQMEKLDCGENFVNKFVNPELASKLENAATFADAVNLHEKATSHNKAKSKREMVYEELNQMIAFVKRLEFQIKK